MPVYALALIGAFTASLPRSTLLTAAPRPAEMVPIKDSEDTTPTNSAAKKSGAIVLKGIESTGTPGSAARKDLPWLGVSAEEAPEVLTSQLALDSGAGLVVNYVAPDSPAAQAGLQKNDVLVEFGGQLLVHPAQLRKLVQARKEGDTVKLVFYRTGRKQTATATLATTTSGFGLLEDEHSWRGDLRELHRQLRELPMGDTIRKEMEVVRKSLNDARIDGKQVQEEIRRSLAEARKAWQEAMKHLTNASTNFGPAMKALRELRLHSPDFDKRTTVTVRNRDHATKTIVKSDDSGTIVIVKDPKIHLTARDKDGKVLFEGEIETVEQRAKVPPEVWREVEPLLKKLQEDSKQDDTLEADDDAAAARGGDVPNDDAVWLLAPPFWGDHRAL